MVLSGSLRKIIVCHLVLIYVLAIINPMLPIIKDAFAHLFLEHHHLETVHHAKGQHHLETELQITEIDKSTINEPIAQASINTLDIHFKVDSIIIFLKYFLVKQTILFHVSFPSKVNLSMINPPPEFV